MILNAAEGKEDESVNAEQGCFHTELLFVGNSNKLVYIGLSDYSIQQH